MNESRPPSREDRTLDLLADRALQGLDFVEQDELNGLLVTVTGVDADALDRAAAAVHAGWCSPSSAEPLPATLRARLVEQVDEQVRGQAAEASADSPILSGPTPASGLSWLGWFVAAASLLWIVFADRSPAPAPSVLEQYAALEAQATDLVELEWQALEDPAAVGAGGEVIWSPSQQQGFMRFRGLAINDPTREQYQLWIFDRNQDDRYPIDGGVFDVDAGEVVIPIDAKIAVGDAFQFAITVEEPGGVVVSSRERIALLAAKA